MDDVCGGRLPLTCVGVAATLIVGTAAAAMSTSVPIAPLIVVGRAVVGRMPAAVVAPLPTAIAAIVLIAAALPMPIAMALVVVTVAAEVSVMLVAPMIADPKTVIGIVLECQRWSIMALPSPPRPVSAPLITVPTTAYPILAAPAVAAKINRPAIPSAVKKYWAIMNWETPKMVWTAGIVAITARLR